MAKKSKAHLPFPSTRWSLVGRAGAEDDNIRASAITELLIAYQPGLRAFLIHLRQLPPDEVDDLLQDFVADKVLVGGLIRCANQGRGKFRNFLLKSLSNYVTTKLHKQATSNKAVNELDENIPSNTADNQDIFDWYWAQQLIQDVLCAMKSECNENGRLDMWDIFRYRVVEPALNGAEPMAYSELINQLNLASPRQAMNLLASAKRMFIRNLRSTISQYLHNESEVDAEIAELRAIVSQLSGKTGLIAEPSM